ncbi:MAG: hypothetical protein ACFFD6_02700 [Candidatus Thorarchaeota archaeon]
MKEESLRVKLVEHRGSTSIFIDAEIDKEGRLVLSGQDIGELPEKHFGDSDYEYWVIVPRDQKDRILLSLMEKLYADNTKAVSEFMDLMKSKGIPYEFGTWT